MLALYSLLTFRTFREEHPTNESDSCVSTNRFSLRGLHEMMNLGYVVCIGIIHHEFQRSMSRHDYTVSCSFSIKNGD